jgi:hypothetical protein
VVGGSIHQLVDLFGVAAIIVYRVFSCEYQYYSMDDLNCVVILNIY